MKGRRKDARGQRWTKGHAGKMASKKRRQARRRVTKRDREAAELAGAPDVRVSTGGILVAEAAPEPLAYLRIRRNGTGEIVRSLAVFDFHDRHLGQVLRHGTQDLDMGACHVDDSEVEALKKARKIIVPGDRR